MAAATDGSPRSMPHNSIPCLQLRLNETANAMRCIGLRSALHRPSQRAAQGIAAQYVLFLSIMTPSALPAPPGSLPHPLASSKSQRRQRKGIFQKETMGRHSFAMLLPGYPEIHSIGTMTAPGERQKAHLLACKPKSAYFCTSNWFSTRRMRMRQEPRWECSGNLQLYP